MTSYLESVVQVIYVDGRRKNFRHALERVSCHEIKTG